MIRTEKWQGKGAGLNPADIDGNKSEPGGSNRLQDFRAKWIADRPDQVRRGQFNARDVVVVPNSQIRESEAPQGGFGTFDLAELGGRDYMMMGNP
jgi:hypothetical protein